MQLPRYVVVGSNTLRLIGEVVTRLRLKEPLLVVTDEVMLTIAAGKVYEALSQSRIAYESVLIRNAIRDEVESVKAAIQKTGSGALIGLGGGKVIDITKLASAETNRPFLSVPTSASHDGIASPVVSIKDQGRPYSLMAQAPLAIVADLDVISQSPYRMIASGCGDVIAKYTAVRDWRLASRIKNEYYGDYAANLALMSARLVIKNAKLIRMLSKQGVSTLVEALISCGVAMSIAGSSRPCSGAEHLFSHALDRIARKPALHGEQCGVGTIICAYLHGANWRLIRKILEIVGAPINAAQLGVSDEEIIEALTTAHKIRPERYTILGETGLTRDAARKVAEQTGVIE
jgi:glycerol-1-phosphate dehydrogenase [NAD(P)+]